MTNIDRCINLFVRQYPNYEELRPHLSVNIYCDILDTRKPEGERIIAKSDCKHDLSRVHYDLPTQYTLI